MKNIPIRFWLISMALIILCTSIIFTNLITRELSIEEHRKMETWAEATKLLLNDEYSDFIFHIIEQNENIPVIIVDDHFRYVSARNFDEPKNNIEEYYNKQIERIKEINEPIEIKLDEYESQYIYYDNSKILKQLSYFPYIQLSLIILFIIIILWAFSTDKRAEQNKVWVGLSKETAHQLGTPITSLLAWIEIIKCKYNDDSEVAEMGKDVKRLQTIAERFSKIGSKPELTLINISNVTESAMEYMQSRSSKKIEYTFEDKSIDKIGNLSMPLYEWVIENLCKNAIDAMTGSGNIDFELFNENGKLIIEITDSGKGIERTKFKTIFKPGFTTKKRGWGLGLSLTKRIIEEYHGGKIYVKSSEIDLGTTFKIEMPLITNN